MNHRDAEELWQRLRTRPWRTLVVLITACVLALIAIWVTAYLQEDARQRATTAKHSPVTPAHEGTLAPLDLSRIKDPTVRQRCQTAKDGPLKAMAEILSSDPEQRKQGMVALMKLGGFSAAVPEVEYLYTNLPPDDPGRQGLRIILDMAKKASEKENPSSIPLTHAAPSPATGSKRSDTGVPPGQEPARTPRDYTSTLFEIVRDPRYSQEGFVKAVPLVATLKREVLARRLVPKLNAAYGWRLSEDGNWSVAQVNDIIYEIVLAPGYDLNLFVQAIQEGRRLGRSHP